jgi:hypothetical protein
MTNRKLLELIEGLKECGNLSGTKFSYAIAKNLNKLSREAEPVGIEIRKLQDKHSKKDKEGNKITEGDKIIMENMDEFSKDFEELMDIEGETTLHKIKQDDLPKEITAKQLSLIFSIVE